MSTSAEVEYRNGPLPPPAAPSLETMLPLQHAMSAAATTRMREEAAARAAKTAKVKLAGKQATQRMQERSWQSGTRRTALFDADDWSKAHETRVQTMQNTFKRLYKPVGSAYWKPDGPGGRKPTSVERNTASGSKNVRSMPSWATELPRALSLNHAALEHLHDDEPHPASPPPNALSSPVPAATFDPMAAPERFYSAFKERIALLRDDVAEPPPMREAVIERAKSITLTSEAAAPIPENEEDTTTATATAVYLTSLEYLNECGIEVPSWDADPTLDPILGIGPVDDGDLEESSRLANGLRVAAGLV